MNWKLIFLLSLFGLAMAFATAFFIPSSIEPVIWLVIFIVCAYIIGKTCTSKYFLNGFMVSIFNCVWITGTHILFYRAYMMHHPDVAQIYDKMPLTGHPRLMMLISGPVIGILSGLILGLFSFIAGKIMKKNK